MHCEDPGCLKACPAPGAIVQYSNGIVDFDHENCIGCGYCIKGCPFNIPRISQGRPQGLQVHAVLRPRRGRPGAGLRQGLPDRRDRVRHQGRHEGVGRRAHQGPEVARLRECRAVRSAGRRRHARDVRAASRRQAADLRGPAGQPDDQPDRRGLEGRQPSMPAWRRSARSRRSASCIISWPGRTRSRAEDEENAKRLTGGQAHDARMTSSRAIRCIAGDPVTVDRYTAGARGSTTGSPRSASCCWRCPAWRCSTRACSS